jgi:plastocyanin
MRLLLALAALTATMGAAPPPAGVTISVRNAAGQPVPNAVVTIKLVGRPTPPPQAGGTYRIDQKNIQFHPFVLAVTPNSQVSFPNLDQVRHHVFSFSPAKRFELKLFAREQSRAVVFDKAGVVALGCNIHDQMTAFIDVVDTPWAARTDASGNVTIGGVPTGAIAVQVWHPYLRAPGNAVGKQVTLGGAGLRDSFTVTLRPPPRMTGSTAY